MRTLIALLVLLGAAFADPVVGVAARRTRNFNFQGRSFSRQMSVRQVGVVVAKGTVLTATLGDDPQNIRIYKPGTTDALDAEVIDSDGSYCLLKVEELDVEPAKFNTTWAPKTGETISWTGLLAGPAGKWSAVRKEARIDAVLAEGAYSDPPFNGPVTSLGALVTNQKGEAVGLVIPAATPAQGGGRGGGRRGGMRQAAGMPLVRSAKVFQQYLSGEMAPRGILGVTVEALDKNVAEALGLGDDIKGLVITQVTADSGAFKAGLAAQDILTHVDGTAIDTPGSLLQALRGRKAGTDVMVLYVRPGEKDNQRQEVKVTLGVREESSKKDRVRAKRFGFVAEPLTAMRKRNLGLDDNVAGLHVRRVTPGSPAALGRPQPLRRGDIILRVGEATVTDLKGLKVALGRLSNGTPVSLFVRSGNATRFVEITPEAPDRE